MQLAWSLIQHVESPFTGCVDFWNRFLTQHVQAACVHVVLIHSIMSWSLKDLLSSDKGTGIAKAI